VNNDSPQWNKKNLILMLKFQTCVVAIMIPRGISTAWIAASLLDVCAIYSWMENSGLVDGTNPSRHDQEEEEYSSTSL
jgi:hypothetical protein